MNRLLAGIALAFALAGCGVGVGSATPASQGAGGDGLSDATTLSQGEWIVLDLDTGAVAGYAALADPAGAAYQDRRIALRRIPAQTATLGQPGSAFARQADEVRTGVALASYGIAAGELTRAQWRRLAGTTPWRDDPLAATWEERDDLPATGMSEDQARAVLAAWSAGHPGTLALPSDAEWEVAARGGGTGAYPWGEARDASAAAWAWTAERGGAAPRPVGSLAANPFGLHDVCGNVWEMTAGGGQRGGSFIEVLALARPANRAAGDPARAHATVGLRLVWRP